MMQFSIQCKLWNCFDSISGDIKCLLKVKRIFSSLFVGEDIDDEEFDNKLEAYFEQLMQPEIRRDINLQNLSERCAALKLSENILLKVGFKFKAQHAQWLLNMLNFQ